MKLSFSTNGWNGLRWEECVRLAEEFRFDGIELYDPLQPRFAGEDAPFGAARCARSVRELSDRGISVCCLDAPFNVANAALLEAAADEISACVRMAAAVRAPFVRLRAKPVAGANAVAEAEDAAVSALVARVLPLAEQMGVTLLLETKGCYADTARLTRLLDSFASDFLAALWDIHYPCREAGETPEQTVRNLGAYIRQVHMKDSLAGENGTEHCLLGEGDLPLHDVLGALRSVSFDGFCSLEWDPEWIKALGDPEIIFPHYTSFMGAFEEKPSWQQHLYFNKTHTGTFVWKKETLIDCTFPQLLDRMVAEYPDQYAFKYTTLDYTRTYAEFRDDVDVFARALVAMGVRPGAKVSIWATNVPQWFLTFWAATKIGATLVTVNSAYKIAEAEYLLRQSDTHTLVMIDGYRDSDYAAIMRELCPELETAESGKPLHCRRLPFLRNIITCGFRMKGCVAWEEALARAKETPMEEVRRRAAAMSPHDVANMQYTSGTTGFPKGVMLTHYNIINNGKCIGDRMDLSTADRMMIQVPMFHCFGMVLSMTAAMTHGVAISPLPYFSPKSALACIHQEHITCFHGVPTMFIAMLQHDDFARTDFSYMRVGIMAGSPCPIAVMRDVVEKMRMTDITIVYGQTEASPGCTMSSSDDPLEVRVATVGHPLPEIECRVVDPETWEELPDGKDGEFVARGYNIMRGYYKMPAATAAAIDRDGWLHTGDLACRTPEGNYRITGRLKDMIIRGGENIYPKEIEEFLYTYPKVKDVQVIGVPSRQYGEEIMACVILREGETADEAEIKRYVSEHMAKHKTPRYVAFMEEFPMNAAGKILKYKMREDAVKALGLENEKTETA